MVTMLQYWEDRYARCGARTVGHHSFTEEEFAVKSRWVKDRLLESAREYFKDKVVLDFGCGPGRLASVVAPLADEYYGVDVVRWAVEEASARVPKGKFTLWDGGRLPFPDGKFDTAMSWTVLQHVPPGEIVGTCKELSRVVRNGGHLVLLENCSVLPSGKHIWFRGPDDYVAMFQGFDLVNSVVWMGMDGNSEDHVFMIMRKRVG